jgi:hypothetical protein
LGTVIFALLQCAKNLRGAFSGGDWNAPITQLSAFAVGVLVIFVASTADVLGSVTINGTAINDLAAGDKILIGLIASSLFGVVFDATKAIDGTQSAATPKLLPGNPPPQD